MTISKIELIADTLCVYEILHRKNYNDSIDERLFVLDSTDRYALFNYIDSTKLYLIDTNYTQSDSRLLYGACISNYEIDNDNKTYVIPYTGYKKFDKPEMLVNFHVLFQEIVVKYMH